MREAIFSALEARDAIHGSRVLDLYAGSGALGLEAASRGASTVVLVERAPLAARACRDNAARVLRNAPADTPPAITVAAQAVASFLDTSTTSWDLVFIDPPYDVDDDELARNLGALAERLAPKAVLIVERAAASSEPTWPQGVRLDRERRYGDTRLWWAQGNSAG